MNWSDLKLTMEETKTIALAQGPILDEVLKAHNPSVRRAPVVWLEQTYDMTFVKNALATLK